MLFSKYFLTSLLAAQFSKGKVEVLLLFIL